MFHRFAAAAAVASAALAVADLIVLLLVHLPLERVAPILALWCMVPAVWGLWAMLAPRACVPDRLPLWGAILGVVVGTLAAFVLNLPARVLGVAVPAAYRLLGAAALLLVYYLLWMLVRAAYRALARAPGSSA